MVTPNRRSFHGYFFLMTVVCILVLAFLPGLSATAGEPVVRVGVYENSPKIFTSEQGEPAGIFIDIIQGIAELEGWTLQYFHGTWTEGLDRLEKGEIDLMPDVAYTAAREKTYAYHKVPVLSDWFQVYARKGSGIKSIVDLDGKRILVLDRSVQQSSFGQMVQGFGIHSILTGLPDYKAIFEKIAAGEADAAITNRFYGMVHAAKYGLEDTAIIFNPTKLFFAAPLQHNGGPLLAAIDNHMDRFKQDSQSIYYTSLALWTSEKVSFSLPAWVRITGLVIGVALIMSLFGSIVLKRQVNIRTRELQDINRDMETRIEQRTAELAVAMQKAQAADHLKSAFLASMSHELRTPLNSIIGFTGILLQGLAGPLNEEQKKQLLMVQNSSRHLLALINDVLDISKIEADQLTLSFSTFDLRPSIEKTVKLVAPLADKKGLELKSEIGPDVAGVTTDQRRLEQIILNLLNNAVKFTEKGRVTLVCRTDKDGYLLSVSDTGIGIRAEEIPGLFQPFHQIDTGLSRKHEGTGLGLSICKKLVGMMGGAIEVQSQWGEGSTFTVRFPENGGESS
ncbi:MAG: ATP-binding protein [Desulfobacteraceae bacterium]|nr:ATP-binding protein [Desulfobacteraceae bacterium]